MSARDDIVSLVHSEFRQRNEIAAHGGTHPAARNGAEVLGSRDGDAAAAGFLDDGPPQRVLAELFCGSGQLNQSLDADHVRVQVADAGQRFGVDANRSDFVPDDVYVADACRGDFPRTTARAVQSR